MASLFIFTANSRPGSAIDTFANPDRLGDKIGTRRGGKPVEGNPIWTAIQLGLVGERASLELRKIEPFASHPGSAENDLHFDNNEVSCGAAHFRGSLVQRARSRRKDLSVWSEKM